MQFGDRVLYDNGSSNTLGVYLKEISSHEALVKLDDNPVKVVLPTDNLTFIKNMDNLDLAQALVVADYIAKEQYDGHYTLFGFSTGYRFCFGTLDKVSYHTTNLMPLGKTIEEAIKKAIDEKVDVDVILDREAKMLRSTYNYKLFYFFKINKTCINFRLVQVFSIYIYYFWNTL